MKKSHWILFLFNLNYLILFSIYFVSLGNYEFVWYAFVVLFFVILLVGTIEKTKFDNWILWSLSIWGLLHMAGGGIHVGDGVLYGLKLIPIYETADFFVLRFDQFVHFYGFGVATLVVCHLLKSGNFRVSNKLFYFIAIIGGMGLGALNELIEFIAVLAFPQTGVGGYFNTGWDLMFNMFGTVFAVFVDYWRSK